MRGGQRSATPRGSPGGSRRRVGISLWTQWSSEGTLLDRNLPTDSLWVVRQEWQCIRAGAKRLSSVRGQRSVVVSAFLNDAQHGGKLVADITNLGQTPALEPVPVSGHPLAGWRVIATDAVRHGVDRGRIAAGALLLLPPGSVTAVVEEWGRGSDPDARSSRA